MKHPDQRKRCAVGIVQALGAAETSTRLMMPQPIVVMASKLQRRRAFVERSAPNRLPLINGAVPRAIG